MMHGIAHLNNKGHSQLKKILKNKRKCVNFMQQHWILFLGFFTQPLNDKICNMHSVTDMRVDSMTLKLRNLTIT